MGGRRNMHEEVYKFIYSLGQKAEIRDNLNVAFCLTIPSPKTRIRTA